MELFSLGWDAVFEERFGPHRSEGRVPLRIVRENRAEYIALGEGGRFVCGLSGKFRRHAHDALSRPATGDWAAVAVRSGEGSGTIHAVLPRRSAFLRKAAGRVAEPQVVAANVDVVFIVCGLDLNFNLRRIERYLSQAGESGALPVVLLNKADLCPDVAAKTAAAAAVARGVAVHAISAIRGGGLSLVGGYLKTGRTAAFLGSSGAGKSTIINALLGTGRLETNEVSELGSRGRHTTTFRELILLPGGGMVIDTPGMRELQVWGGGETVDRAFGDIEELAAACRFRDCRHQDEPGCAVRAAAENGLLDPERYGNFLKLKKESAYLESRLTMNPGRLEKKHWKTISKSRTSVKKLKHGR